MAHTTTLPLLLTVHEVARETSTHPHTIRRLIDAGSLRAVRVGSKAIRIPRAELDRLLASAST